VQSSTPYASGAVGLELNLFTYVRADVMTGVRATGALATRGLASHALAGPYLAVSLGFGKF
jgi:hypothetical protein